jgi:hypothetical protein
MVHRRMVFNDDRSLEERHRSKRESMGKVMDEERIGGGETMLAQTDFKS